MSKQYLYRVSILNRKTSHPLEAISHYSGESQHDVMNSKNYTSNTSENVIWNRVMIPPRHSSLYSNLPEYIKFRGHKKDLMSNARNILWRNVFTREKRDDAQFARLFEVSIPGFLSPEQATEAISNFAQTLVNEGMIADCSIHSRQKNLNQYSLLEKILNPQKEKSDDTKSEGSIDYTGYLMCTLRDYENGIFINKNREWNDKKKMELWRSKWVEILAKAVNEADIPMELKNSWEEKLNIYSEYKKIRENMDVKPAKLSMT